MDDQQLRPIPGNPKYLVSSCGQVYSLSSKRYIVQNQTPSGYKYVSIIRAGDGSKYTGQFVHRLVLKAFVGEPKEGQQANHINGIKHDNRLENLEWVSRSENMKHALANGLSSIKGENHHRAILNDSQVLEIKELILANNLFYKEIAEIYNVSYSTINNIARGHRWGDLTGLGKVQRLAHNERRHQVMSKRGLPKGKDIV